MEEALLYLMMKDGRSDCRKIRGSAGAAGSRGGKQA